MPKVKKKRKAVMPKMKMGVHKSRSGGLTAKGVAAYRRANPGSKLKTAVTESNPKGKRAGRRKSFCSRMCGMKKRLTSAKTSRDLTQESTKLCVSGDAAANEDCKVQQGR